MGKLKKTDTNEKIVLPTTEDIEVERKREKDAEKLNQGVKSKAPKKSKDSKGKPAKVSASPRNSKTKALKGSKSPKASKGSKGKPAKISASPRSSKAKALDLNRSKSPKAKRNSKISKSPKAKKKNVKNLSGAPKSPKA